MKRSLFERRIQTSGLNREFSLAENDVAQFLRESPEPGLLCNLNLETITSRWIQCGLCRRESPEQWRQLREKLEFPHPLEIDEAILAEPSLFLDLLFLLFLDRSIDPPAKALYTSMLHRRWINPAELITSIAASSDLSNIRQNRARISIWRRVILAIRYRLVRSTIRQKRLSGLGRAEIPISGASSSQDHGHPPLSNSGGAWNRRIGIVVPRFGEGFSGGMERLALEAANLMQDYAQVRIFTTCATDYLTWANTLTEGTEQIGKLEVHRFPVDRPRNLSSYVASETNLRNSMVQNATSAGAHTSVRANFLGPGGSDLQNQWMVEQGPISATLEKAVRAAVENGEVDALFFFSLQYATTARLLVDLSSRLPCLLVPTAHPDWTLEVPMLQECLQKSWGWIVSTPEEESMLRRALLSSGFQGPSRDDTPPESNVASEPTSNIQQGPPAYPGGLPIPVPNRSEAKSVEGGGVGILGLSDQPYALFVGRLDPSKGLDELLQYFLARHIIIKDKLKLVLVGNPAMAIPRHPSIIVTGYVSDAELDRIYGGATLLINPSPYESLSIVLLEAWARGMATLSNGRSEVLQAQTARSAAGLCYENLEQFMGGIEFLLQNPDIGLNGIEFVKENYSSDAIGQNYKRILTEVFQKP